MLRRRWFVMALVALSVFAGCSRRQPAPGASRATIPPSIAWAPVAGAQRYVVRGWSGHQLLFEITTAETTLTLTPSLARAIAAFDSATAEIMAEGANGDRERLRVPLLPIASGGNVGAGGGT